MPNWCSNNLYVYGEKEDMMNFLYIISRKLDEKNNVIEANEVVLEDYKHGDVNVALLENLYPTPPGLLIGDAPVVHNDIQKTNLERCGYPDWYQWRIDKWGTKWPESDLYFNPPFVSGNHIEIDFDFQTAWSPPVEAFDQISKDYPNLLFCLYYLEEGMGFCGRNVWINGESIESYQAEYINNEFDTEYLFSEYKNK